MVDEVVPAGAQEQIGACVATVQKRKRIVNEKLGISLGNHVALTADLRFHSLRKYLVCGTSQDPSARTGVGRATLTMAQEVVVNVRDARRVAERNAPQRG